MPAALPPSPLYVIADVTPSRPDPLAFIETVLRAGARIIQLRAKSLARADYRTLAREVQRLCTTHSAVFIVNDHLDIAYDLRAGLHIGQGDTHPVAARNLLGDDAILGLSTHNLAQFHNALALSPPLTYIAVGPIFATTTKHDADPVVGLDFIRTARASFNNNTTHHTATAVTTSIIPPRLVAIGGITLSNAESVFAAGADTVAVIGDLANAPDPAAHTRALLATRPRVC